MTETKAKKQFRVAVTELYRKCVLVEADTETEALIIINSLLFWLVSIAGISRFFVFGEHCVSGAVTAFDGQHMKILGRTPSACM